MTHLSVFLDTATWDQMATVCKDLVTEITWLGRRVRLLNHPELADPNSSISFWHIYSPKKIGPSHLRLKFGGQDPESKKLKIGKAVDLLLSDSYDQHKKLGWAKYLVLQIWDFPIFSFFINWSFEGFKS